MRSKRRRTAKLDSKLARSITSKIVSILKAAGIEISHSRPYVETTFQNGLMKSLEFIIIVEVKDQVGFPEIEGATLGIWYEIIFPMKKFSIHIITHQVVFEPSSEQDQPSFEWRLQRVQDLEKKISTIINQSLDIIVSPFTKTTTTSNR